MYRPLPKNVILKKSNIEGYGLFAKTDILKGTMLGISHVQNDVFPDGWIRTPLGGYYNHSENPNCKLIETSLGYTTKVKILKAIADIKEGVELTCTYTLYKFCGDIIKKKGVL